ncbi:FadR family transcriptional regulator [Neorhizobium lilium]|uniref:FadR family transcriptional regulator n=2 Tax=Neorhizobium lilium TaxID=2503024 RepID=A0A3S4UVF6_9HYPH|nr:FadR family transcriptional regulator [Neorhizobium lilium]
MANHYSTKMQYGHMVASTIYIGSHKNQNDRPQGGRTISTVFGGKPEQYPARSILKIWRSTMNAGIDVKNSPSSIEEVTQAILGLAGNGDFPPERQLAEQIGVSRHMLRKALSTLRDENSIPENKSRGLPPSKGKARNTKQAIATRANIASRTSPAELWEVRLLLEPEIARLAAIRGTPTEIDDIVAAHALSEPTVFDRGNDNLFHRAIAVASHNILAAYLLEQVMDLTWDETIRTRLPAYTNETGWRHHEMIVDAIRGRRAAEAEQATREHLVAILKWLNGGDTSTPMAK